MIGWANHKETSANKGWTMKHSFKLVQYKMREHSYFILKLLLIIDLDMITMDMMEHMTKLSGILKC